MLPMKATFSVSSFSSSSTKNSRKILFFYNIFVLFCSFLNRISTEYMTSFDYFQLREEILFFKMIYNFLRIFELEFNVLDIMLRFGQFTLESIFYSWVQFMIRYSVPWPDTPPTENLPELVYVLSVWQSERYSIYQESLKSKILILYHLYTLINLTNFITFLSLTERHWAATGNEKIFCSTL